MHLRPRQLTSWAPLCLAALLSLAGDVHAQCGTLEPKTIMLERYLRQFTDPERQAFRERNSIQQLAPDVERHVETDPLVCGPLRKRVREELAQIMGGGIQNDQFDLAVLDYGGLYHVVPIEWVIPETATVDVSHNGMVLFFDAQTGDFITFVL